LSLTALLQNWQSTPQIADNVAAWRVIPAQPAQTEPFPADMHPSLVKVLRARGIDSLYAHQAQAWRLAQTGQHPVIVTGTASGKTLCYNLPVLHRLLHRPHTRALYLFPTKALAQDQAQAVRGLLTGLIKPAVTFTAAAYDGDTPAAQRPAIRQHARLLLTNPDMLHTGILPHHPRWAEFFQHLAFVVVDELHAYRGVFGSHVANVLRRLARIARFYGASPQFILTSATIANPAQLAGRLIEAPVAVVNTDGSARGAKHFVIYNPPVVDRELGLRRSALTESVRLARDLLAQNVQTILFGRARRTVELLLTYLRAEAPDDAAYIRGYRSGYLPHQRRDIERGLRQGQVRAVVATSALELGVDIGSMEAAILAGYPGTIAAVWQRAGRAGRTHTDSLAVLVTSANPLDQFLAHHPAYFFERSPEHALINPNNLLILWQHVRCAAFELPFAAGQNFGQAPADTVAELLRLLHQAGDLHLSGGKYFWMADQYPAEAVSLRSASPQRVLLQTVEGDTPRTIGEVDAASASWMVHPQAIYLHEGQSYVVDVLDLGQNTAVLKPAAVDYYTEPHRETSIQLVESRAQAGAAGGSKAFGDIVVTTQVTGYKIVRLFTHERLGMGQVSLPPTELQTTGYWLTIAPNTVDRLREAGLWANDPIDYGPTWPQQRQQARARDGYRCQMCGAREQDRQHDVHHKTPFRTFASHREANQPDNLITLCRACHRRAETAVRMRSGLAGLAFALEHLAPLFLMCDINDIAVHADPAAPLAQGQPAVVIYDLAPGGMGFSERLFELHADLLAQALELVAACPCTDGCPSCIGPAGEEGAGGKQETLAILKQVAR
jgi:DEAD/DEAH box helicase domain-containing protein